MDQSGSANGTGGWRLSAICGKRRRNSGSASGVTGPMRNAAMRGRTAKARKTTR
jgi:hypothetical protein